MRMVVNLNKKQIIFDSLIVQKRDGRQEKFNLNKMIFSLKRSGQLDIDDKIADIFDLIFQANEDSMIKSSSIKEIISYVNQDESEDKFAKKMSEIEEKATNLEYQVNQLRSRNTQIVNENANKDSRVFNTQRDLTAGVLSKVVGLDLLPEVVKKAHLKGQIHYHDLDYHPYAPMTNCCLIDFKQMFENGFQIGNAQVESPKSIQTATAQMAQIIANVASSQYGGTSVNRIDELLEQYAELNYQKHLKTAAEWIEEVEKQK